jgi:hypothetical protein
MRRTLGIWMVAAVGCGGGAQDSGATPKSGPAPTAPEQKADAGEAAKPGAKAAAAAPDAEALRAKLDQFAVAEVTADLSELDAGDREALSKLIAASRLLDAVFDRQAWAGNPKLATRLRANRSAAGKLQYEYFGIMRGPWDRQAHFEPFAIDTPHPPGAGFYPEDLTAEEFHAWVAAHPEDKEAFEGLYTVIQRDGDGLVAVPYSKVYGRWLEPAATLLEDAADLTANASLATFLRTRAAAFLSDDYYESDKAWMDLDSRVEITIGPYETYEDELLGLKASFESFVTVSDPKASADLAKYKKYLPAMEQNLPVPDEMKSERGAESPIRVVDLVFTSADARKSVQTIAFNLPNDERVRKEKGAKKVLLRNLIRTKFDRIMRPIGERLLVDDLHPHLSADAFFHQVLFHELSHSLGPGLLTRDGAPVEVRVLLGPAYSPLEEAKADVMGVYNVLFMIEKGELPAEFRAPVLVSYFAGLFRSVRFGVAEAHGKGAALQINRYLEAKAATLDATSGRYSVDLDALESAVEALVTDLVTIQHEGDPKKAEAFLAKYGVSSPAMDEALARLDGIPVDIRPVYPVANENMPPR